MFELLAIPQSSKKNRSSSSSAAAWPAAVRRSRCPLGRSAPRRHQDHAGRQGRHGPLRRRRAWVCRPSTPTWARRTRPTTAAMVAQRPDGHHPRGPRSTTSAVTSMTPCTSSRSGACRSGRRTQTASPRRAGKKQACRAEGRRQAGPFRQVADHDQRRILQVASSPKPRRRRSGIGADIYERVFIVKL